MIVIGQADDLLELYDGDRDISRVHHKNTRDFYLPGCRGLTGSTSRMATNKQPVVKSGRSQRALLEKTSRE